MESIAPAASAAPAERPAARAAILTLPWHVSAMLLGSTSIIVGLLWDISWHRTIGRDTFWTPAHMAIYLGGVLAGLSCGWLALSTTFAGTPAERAAAVRFWGFRAPLGRLGGDLGRVRDAHLGAVRRLVAQRLRARRRDPRARRTRCSPPA